MPIFSKKISVQQPRWRMNNKQKQQTIRKQMPSVSFAKPTTETPVTLAAETPAPATPVESNNAAAPASTAVVVAPPLPVAANNKFRLNDFLPSFGDVIWPRINFVQAIGELKDSFAPGSIVLNQEALLYRPPVLNKDGSIKEPGTSPVTITCLGFRPTRYVEYVKGGAKGMIVETEAQVRENGGTTDYNEHKLKEAAGMKKFDVLAEALLAIERPEFFQNDGTVFCYPCNGKQYALALWSCKRTSYTHGAKILFTKRAMGCLRENGYPSYSFKLSSRWKSWDSNGAWIPVLVEQQKQPVEFLAWVQSVLNPAEAINSGAADA